jgi:hypothetical protein
MLDEQKLKKAQNQLLESVREVINQSYKDSQKDNVPISNGHMAGQIMAAVLFNNIYIDQDIAEALYDANIKSFSVNLSVGQFLRDGKTLRKSKKWIIKTENNIHSKLVDKTKITSYTLQCASIDYLKELYHCLELISILVRKSKRIQRKKNGFFLEYCALCWRLVNKNKLLNFDESTDYSASYCIEHHPKKADWNYHLARNTLISAIEKTNSNLKEELIERKKDNEITPLFLYKSTATFAKKHPKKDMVLFHSGDTWKDRASLIKNLAESYYPNASLAMKSIYVLKLFSWEAWFNAVINALDTSGKDMANWGDAGTNWNRITDDQASVSEYVGETVLLNIIHRYEAVSNINAIPRLRGPKKGTVATNKSLRAVISKLAKEQKANDRKINASEIAKKLNISRQRVNVLVKELGLR